MPFRPVTVSKVEDRPRLLVLCDVSLSVRSTARFTLHLVHSLQSVASSVRTFAFVKDLVEITDLFAEHRIEDALSLVMSGLPAGGVLDVDADSDYGSAFEQFLEQFGLGGDPPHHRHRARRRPRQRQRPASRRLRGDQPPGPLDHLADARSRATRGAWAAATCRCTPSSATGSRWSATCMAWRTSPPGSRAPGHERSRRGARTDRPARTDLRRGLPRRRGAGPVRHRSILAAASTASAPGTSTSPAPPAAGSRWSTRCPPSASTTTSPGCSSRSCSVPAGCAGPDLFERIFTGVVLSGAPGRAHRMAAASTATR